jgi:hypothetical protein
MIAIDFIKYIKKNDRMKDYFKKKIFFKIFINYKEKI